VGNGIDLVFPEGYFRIHSGEADMLTIILTRAQGIKGFVVDVAEPFPAVNVFPV
jgi:hypothetical protein